MLGKTVSVKGEIRSAEDITIGGRVEGNIVCEGCAVVIEATADVTGDILAADITIQGRSAGQLTATDVVDIRRGATVTGTVVSKRFILEDEALFTGRVEPQHLEAAMSVAKFRQRQRDASA